MLFLIRGKKQTDIRIHTKLKRNKKKGDTETKRKTRERKDGETLFLPSISLLSSQAQDKYCKYLSQKTDRMHVKCHLIALNNGPGKSIVY